jgi:hypothetical protein
LAVSYKEFSSENTQKLPGLSSKMESPNSRSPLIFISPEMDKEAEFVTETEESTVPEKFHLVPFEIGPRSENV